MTLNLHEEKGNISLREIIENFIQVEKLGPKLEQKEKEIEKEKESGGGESAKLLKLQNERDKLLEEHQRENWIESAAKRSSQIKVATHAPKYMHSKAKCSSVFLVDSEKKIGSQWLCTHTLDGDGIKDVVGNAAVFDVYTFMKLECQGKTILERVLEHNDELVLGFSDNKEKGMCWLEQFASVSKNIKEMATHGLSKQLYFPISEGQYHLLGPLFPTSLVHSVWRHLQDAQFSDASQEARKCKRKAKPSKHGFADYLGLAAQVFGGTKPQNISLLNCERHGEAWLLPSCPPNWKAKEINPPLGVKTVFGRWFGRRKRVHETTKSLARFLSATDFNNTNIRRTRAGMVDLVVDELVQFTAEIHQLEPGWSAAPGCILYSEEVLWLDPGRSQNDEAFAAQLISENWQEQVAASFGRWFNNQLRFFSKHQGELPLGDVEQRAWHNVAEQALGILRTEVFYNEK